MDGMTLPAASADGPKIALVTDWFAPRRGGIEAQLLGLGQALKREGAEVTVITSLPGPAMVEGIDVVRMDCPLLPGAQVAVPWRLKARLTDVLRSGDFDIVHAHPSIVAPVCLAGVQAARALGLPSLVTFHSSMASLPRALAAANRAFRWTAGNVTLSAVSRTIAGQIACIDPTREPIVLPNGFDDSFWQAGPHVMPAAPGKPFAVATAMRLQATKRPRALLRVFVQARDLAASDNVGLHLTIAGDGSHATRMKREASRLGLDDCVTFAGWLDRTRMRALYARSQAFFLPSTKEAFGIAGLEARACGLPVIARSGTGMTEYLKDGEDGFLADSDDAMARALAQIAVQREDWSRLAGPRPSLSRFGWNRIASRHMEIYRSMLALGV